MATQRAVARLELLNARYQHAELDMRMAQAKRAISSALDEVNEQVLDCSLGDHCPTHPPYLYFPITLQLSAQFEDIKRQNSSKDQTVKLLRKYGAERRMQQRR